MEAIAKSLELLYTWFALVGVRNDKRNPNFCPFCLKRVTLSTPWAAKTSQASTKLTRELIQLHMWNSIEPIIHSSAFTRPTRLKLSGHFTLTSMYMGFWLQLREIHKYLWEINKCPRDSLLAGFIHIASSIFNVDFKCPSDPHGSFPPTCS